MDSFQTGIKRRWQRAFSSGAPNIALRIAVMFAGLFCVAFGIAMAKFAAVGTSPISSLPAVLTETSERLGVPLTMGAWTFVFNFIFFLMEIALLREKFNPVQFLQIPLFFVLSVAVDGWLWLFQPLPLDNYIEQIACLFLSIAVLGSGIRIQMAAGLLMTPGDAIVQVIAYVTQRRFDRCKIAWDATLVIFSAALSFLLLGGLYQVREGTIVAALLVGTVAGIAERALRRFAWLIPEGEKPLIPPLCPPRAGGGS